MRRIALVLLCSVGLLAQDAQLTATVEKLDQELFSAYNGCELDRVAALVSDDIEFYHDRGGLTGSKTEMLDALKRNICGKVRRELVAESHEIYPVPGFGAIQAGKHRFFVRDAAGKESGGRVAKFLHIWKKEGDKWLLTRVVSYAH